MQDRCDAFDLKILDALQADGALSNQALAERVHLSPSQCSRRRARLEAAGLIRRYRAVLAADRLGFGILALVGVRLATHSPDNAARFRRLVAGLPEVQEAFALTGDIDYQLKLAVPSLKALSDIINDVLLAHEAVQTVQSSIVLDTLKDDNLLPLPTI